MVSSAGGFYSNCRWTQRERFQIYAAPDVASAVDVINDLGLDTLTFLGVTVMVVPAFKIIKTSPILGFFFAGVVLNQFGLIKNLTDVKVLSEWGILFLLFEMGLELSLARLKALAKFAFGMGLTQVVLCTLAFTAFELPPNGAIGTRILEFLFHSRLDLGYNIVNQASSIRADSYAFSHVYRHFFYVPYTCNQLVGSRSSTVYHRMSHQSYITPNVSKGTPLLTFSFSGARGFYSNCRWTQRERFQIYAALDVASAVDVINDLGLGTLTFLGVNVMVVPAFKIIKISPGFFSINLA